MHWFKGAQAVDLGFALLLTALILVTISSRRARRLARIQEEQLRQRTAEITVRRRLAEVLGRQHAV